MNITIICSYGRRALARCSRDPSGVCAEALRVVKKSLQESEVVKTCGTQLTTEGVGDRSGPTHWVASEHRGLCFANLSANVGRIRERR